METNLNEPLGTVNVQGPEPENINLLVQTNASIKCVQPMYPVDIVQIYVNTPPNDHPWKTLQMTQALEKELDPIRVPSSTITVSIKVNNLQLGGHQEIPKGDYSTVFQNKNKTVIYRMTFHSLK